MKCGAKKAALFADCSGGSAVQPVLECTFDVYMLLFPVILSFDDMGSFLNRKPETMCKIYF